MFEDHDHAATAKTPESPDSSAESGPRASESDWALIADVFMDDPFPSRSALSRFKVRTWPKLPKKRRNIIDAETENFADEHDYFKREMLTPGARHLLRQELPAAPSYEALIQTKVTAVFADARMRSGSSATRVRYVKKQIDDLLRQTEALLRAAFDVDAKPGRPVSKASLHGRWSQLKCLGKTYTEIADQASSRRKRKIHENDIKIAVLRHRKRRQELQWLLRYLIHHREDKVT
ncbi:MAG: hypothetical protein ACJ746_13545 [Bryobacteraceae bacterium]